MALSRNTSLKFHGLPGPVIAHPVAATTNILRGAALSHSGGYVGNLATGQKFVGFADGSANNSLGSNGDEQVGVVSSGVVEVAIPGITVADLLADVFAADNATFTLTEGSNVHVGKVAGVGPSGSGTALLSFDAALATESA